MGRHTGEDESGPWHRGALRSETGRAGSGMGRLLGTWATALPRMVSTIRVV